MYERKQSSTSYKIPQCCCSCLGPAEKRLMIVTAREWTDKGIKYRQSYDINVPICSACKQRVRMRRLIGFGLFLVSCLAAWFLWGLKWNEWEIWLAIAVLVAGLIAFGYLWFAGLPARIDDSGVPHFENPDYERYFRELNGIADPR